MAICRGSRGQVTTREKSG